MSRLTLILVTCALALTAPVTLRAQTPSPQKVISACYVPGSGTVYRIKETDLKQECASPRHVAFSWTDGSVPGFTFRVQSAEAFVSEGDEQIVVVSCPSGSSLTGGGFRLTQVADVAAPLVRASEPDPFNGSAWRVDVVNRAPSATPAIFRAFAQCIK